MKTHVPATTNHNSVTVSRAATTFFSTIILCGIPAFCAIAFINELLAGSFVAACMYLGYLMITLYCFTAPILHGLLDFYLDAYVRPSDQIRYEAAYSRFLFLLDKLPVAKSWFIAADTANLAGMKLLRGEYAGAEKLFREALSIAAKDQRTFHSGALAIYYSSIAIACSRQNEFAEADYTIKLAFNQLKECRSKQPAFEGYLYLGRGALRLEDAEFEEAIEDLTRAEEILTNAKLPYQVYAKDFNVAVHRCHLLLALAYGLKGDQTSSSRECQKYFAEPVAGFDKFESLSIKWLNLLAAVYLKQNNFEYAERLLQEAYTIGQSCPMHEDTFDTLEQYERLLVATNRQDEIPDMKRWVHPNLLTLAHSE